MSTTRTVTFVSVVLLFLVPEGISHCQPVGARNTHSNSVDSILWSEITNHLSAGVLIEPQKTKEALSWKSHAFLKNTGTTNIGWGWIGPDKQLRVHVDLFDETHKPVPPRQNQREFDSAAKKAYANLLGLPKTKHGVRAGHLLLPAAQAVPYWEGDLRDFFDVKIGSNYTAVFTILVLKIESNLDLMVVRSPQIKVKFQVPEKPI